MKPGIPPDVPGDTAEERFSNAVKMVLAVPKEVIEKEKARLKKAKARKKRARERAAHRAISR